MPPSGVSNASQPLDVRLGQNFNHSPEGHLGDRRVKAESAGAPRTGGTAPARAPNPRLSSLNAVPPQGLRAESKVRGGLMATSALVGDLLGALSESSSHRVDVRMAKHLLDRLDSLSQAAAPSTGLIDITNPKPPDPKSKPEVTLLWFASRGLGWNEIKATYIPKQIPPAPTPKLIESLDGFNALSAEMKQAITNPQPPKPPPDSKSIELTELTELTERAKLTELTERELTELTALTKLTELELTELTKLTEPTVLWYACRGIGLEEMTRKLPSEPGKEKDDALAVIDAMKTYQSMPPSYKKSGALFGEVNKMLAERNIALADINAMKALRDHTVNGMLDMLINKNHQELRLTSSGSDNPSSDYDVQLYDAGGLQGNPGMIIAEFNSLFRERFGCESGTLFDTNIYDPSFRLPREDAVENAEITASEQRVAKDNDNTQIVGSLAKIRRFASDPTWKEFEQGLREDLRGEELKRATEQLSKACELINGFNDAISLRKQQIIAREPAFKARADSPDGELRVRNELYAEKLEAVHKARQQQGAALAKLKVATGAALEVPTSELDQATLVLKSAMVEATLFAHEAYYSEGPMIDVVGNQQGVIRRAAHYPGHDPEHEPGGSWGGRTSLPNRELRPADMMGSFNEQFGDALKDIDHYGHRSAADPDRFANTAVQTSKYVQRLFKIATAAGFRLDQNDNSFNELNDELKKLRDESGLPGPDLLNKLNKLGINIVAKLEAHLLKLAVRVNVHLYSRQGST